MVVRLKVGARAGHPSHRQAYNAQPSLRPMGVVLELYGLCKDGSEYPVDIMLSPVETAEGESSSVSSATSQNEKNGRSSSTQRTATPRALRILNRSRQRAHRDGIANNSDEHQTSPLEASDPCAPGLGMPMASENNANGVTPLEE